MTDLCGRRPTNQRSVGTAATERKRHRRDWRAQVQVLQECDRCAYAARMAHRHCSIRIATRDDLDALLALEQATFTSDRISRAQWRRHIASATASVLVDGTAGDVRGAAVALYRRNARSARLYSLAVRADCRGTGLGAALLAAVEAVARQRGCDALRLEVRIDNAAAIALYERHGYRRTGCVPGFYEDGADAWRYSKPLAGAGEPEGHRPNPTA